MTEEKRKRGKPRGSFNMTRYNKVKNKWIPIEKSTEKRPNYIKEIY